MKNKCEELGIEHAWRSTQEVVGFSINSGDKCANCDLSRTYCTKTEEWYRYSDGRPDEPIINIRPV